MTILYTTLKACLAAEQPVAVATIIDGTEQIGAKLLVRPGEALLGTLGNSILNEAVERDALAMLLRAESG
ncbi:MAG: XdhC family protein, partial [Roseiflexus sp.]